jgi:putative Ca2+/H+ antiporter (TMEM165/GDT1 family)
MFQELLKAFFLIFIAEMGDKTQILAMAFATKYPAKKVLAGIFAGCLLNHGLAVLLGSYISKLIPLNIVQIIAGFAFVGFALWTLKPESDGGDDESKKSKFGPVITVAAAFFIGELGDKTQLTAITLATDALYPLVILAGTVSGMVVTGGIGIIVGKKLGDKIPEFAIKIIAASVFMLFGVTKLYNTMPKEYLKIQYILVFAVVAAIAVLWLLRASIVRRKQGNDSLFIKTSRELYNYYHQAREKMENICLGESKCGNCQGQSCIIGYTKLLIENGLEGIDSVDFDAEDKNFNKDYDKGLVLETLKITLGMLKNDSNNPAYNNLHRIRKNLEVVLLGKSVVSMGEWHEYVNALTDIDRDVAESLLEGME